MAVKLSEAVFSRYLVEHGCPTLHKKMHVKSAWGVTSHSFAKTVWFSECQMARQAYVNKSCAHTGHVRHTGHRLGDLSTACALGVICWTYQSRLGLSQASAFKIWQLPTNCVAKALNSAGCSPEWRTCFF